MTIGILRSVRFAFVTLLLGLTVFAMAESALGLNHDRVRAESEEPSSCGTQAQPCTLEPVAAVGPVAARGVGVGGGERLAVAGPTPRTMARVAS